MDISVHEDDEWFALAHDEMWDGKCYSDFVNRQTEKVRAKYRKMSAVLMTYAEIRMPIVRVQGQEDNRGEVTSGDGYPISRECNAEDVQAQHDDNIAEQMGYDFDDQGRVKLPPNSAKFIKQLKDRKTHLAKAGIGQIAETDTGLSLDDVFNRRKTGANSRFFSKIVKDQLVPTYITSFVGTDHQKVGFPVVPSNWRPGMVAGPVITPAPTCAVEEMRKVLLSGNHYKNFSRCLSQVDFQSQLPTGSAGKAFIALVDIRTAIATEGVLCALWLDLGKNVCQAHLGPQINLNIRGEEIDTLCNSLCISTQFKDVDGYPPGTTIMTYETMEFTEAHKHIELLSRCKPTWDQIEASNIMRGKRVMAGLNLLDVLEKKDDSGEKPVVEEFALIAAPARVETNPHIFDKHGVVYKPKEFRSKLDLRAASVREFKLSDLPSSSQGWDDRLKHSEFKMPDIGNHLETGRDRKQYNFPITAFVKKDCKLGAVVARCEVVDTIQSFRGSVSQQIMENGISEISGEFDVYSMLAPLSGIAFACVLDRFARFESVVKSNIADCEMINLFPHYIFTLREQASFKFDISQGVGVHCRDKECKIYVVCVNANVDPLASDWYFNIFGKLDIKKREGCFGISATYPTPTLSGRLSFGPLVFKKQEEWQVVKVDSNFASPLANVSYIGYDSVRAKMANFLAISGNCKCTVEVISSPLVFGLIGVVSNFPGEIKEWADFLKVPSSLTHDTIPFRTKYGMVPTRGVTGKSTLQLYPISGISGVKDIKDDFVCWLHVDLCDMKAEPLGKIQHESWFTMAAFTEDDCDIKIDASVKDFECSTATVAMSVSPFAILAATHAFYVGNVTLHISWCSNKKLSEISSTINVSCKSGPGGYDCSEVTTHCGTNSGMSVPFKNHSGIMYAGVYAQMIPYVEVSISKAKELRNIHFSLDCADAQFFGPKPFIVPATNTS